MRVCLLASVWLLGLTTVSASPRLIVKSRPIIDGLRVANAGSHVEVSGTLRDDLGTGLPLTQLTVFLEPNQRDVQTDAAGHFQVKLPVEGEGARTIRVIFKGSPLLGVAEQTLKTVVGRMAVVLDTNLPAEVQADQILSIGIWVHTESGQPIPGLSVQVQVDQGETQTARTDRAGHAVADTDPLKPGTHQLHATWKGDDVYHPALLDRAFEASRPLSVTLKAAQTHPAPGHPVVLMGTVAGGSQVIPVILLADGRKLAQRRSASNGAFEFAVDSTDVEPGEVSFQVATRVEQVGLRDGLSPPVIVVIPKPLPASPLWTWIPAGLAGLALFGVGLGRVRTRIKRPRAQPSPSPTLKPASFEPATRTQRGHGLLVTIIDSQTGAPVIATVVGLEGEGPPQSQIEPPLGERTLTDAQGNAQLTLPTRIWACAPGYAPVSHPVPAHTRAATLRLQPLRAALQTLYADLLARSGAPPLVFGLDTPREAASTLQQRGSSDQVVPLTRAIEAICFGPKTPDYADLLRVYTLIDTVRRGLHA